MRFFRQCVLFCLAILFSSGCYSCRAQGDSTVLDSLRFVAADWHRVEDEGIVFCWHQFVDDSQLFGAAQYVFLMEIPSTEVHRIHYAYDSLLAPTSMQAQRYEALAAVNGSFFDMKKGNPICFLRIDSIEVGENTPLKTDSIHRKYYQYATLCLAGDSLDFVIPDSSRFSEQSLTCKDIMTAGPMLLHCDSVMPQRDDRTFVTHRHNRTAVGQRADGTVVILVADGRSSSQAAGFSLPELARVMRWLGCRHAINFDGGGSSTFYWRCRDGESCSPVRNFPSDNGAFDHEGERPVSSILYIAPKMK